jgi:N-acetylglucosaminyl-diphospho-decaprenol L-rhamnosyltransferase
MIGIVVLNYINWSAAEKCLQSILSTIGMLDVRIYLIDNASPIDAPISMLPLMADARVRLTRNNTNLGYSAGNNVGIRQALDDGCECVLISNSDIIFLDNSISSMHEYLIAHPDVGIVGPKLLDLEGKTTIPEKLIPMGLKEKYLVTTFLRYLFPAVARDFFCKPENVDKTFRVHAVSGSCFMMNRECASSVTPFDENTFLFEEEYIIGIRMERQDRHTVYYPGSAVIHAHGQSTRKVMAFSYICFVQSELYYCRKYLGMNTLQVFPLFLIRVVGYLVRCAAHEDFRSNLTKFYNETIPSIVKRWA